MKDVFCFTILQSTKTYQIINFPENKNQHIGTWKVPFCFKTGDAELGNHHLGGENSNIFVCSALPREMIQFD